MGGCAVSLQIHLSPIRGEWMQYEPKEKAGFLSKEPRFFILLRQNTPVGMPVLRSSSSTATEDGNGEQNPPKLQRRRVWATENFAIRYRSVASLLRRSPAEAGRRLDSFGAFALRSSKATATENGSAPRPKGRGASFGTIILRLQDHSP